MPISCQVGCQHEPSSCHPSILGPRSLVSGPFMVLYLWDLCWYQFLPGHPLQDIQAQSHGSLGTKPVRVLISRLYVTTSRWARSNQDWCLVLSQKNSLEGTLVKFRYLVCNCEEHGSSQLHNCAIWLGFGTRLDGIMPARAQIQFWIFFRRALIDMCNHTYFWSDQLRTSSADNRKH